MTWGNKSKDKKEIPLFVPTTLGKKISKSKNASGVYFHLLNFHLSHGKPMDFPRELDTNIIYKKSIFEFLNKLDKRI